MTTDHLQDLRRREDQEIVAALRFAGLEVASVFDLVNSRTSYPQAVPILVKMLSAATDSWIKEGIVRALTRTDARGKIVPSLLDEWRRLDGGDEQSQGLKWAIGNALSVVAEESDLEDLLEIWRDKTQGKAREMISEALARIRHESAEDALIWGLEDPELALHALSALRRRRSARAAPAIERLLLSNDASLRTKARQALDALSKHGKKLRRLPAR